MKNYYTRNSEFYFAQSKLEESKVAKQKAEESPNKKGNDKKIKNIDRIKQKVKLFLKLFLVILPSDSICHLRVGFYLIDIHNQD